MPSGEVGCLPTNRKRAAPLKDPGSYGNPRKIMKLSCPQSLEFPHGNIRGFTNINLPVPDDTRFFFASNVAEFPANKYVSRRVILWTDGSVRKEYGAAAVVWQERGATASNIDLEWENLQIPYPTRIKSSTVVELFGVAEAMKHALNLIEKSSANALRHSKSNPQKFQDILQEYDCKLTWSHVHDMFRELFIFTDSEDVLKMIATFNIRHPDRGPLVRAELTKIYYLSCEMQRRGIHLEFHLSRGHSGIEGNRLADRWAGQLSRQMSGTPRRSRRRRRRGGPISV